MKEKKVTLKSLQGEIESLKGKNKRISSWTIFYSTFTLLATIIIAISTYLNYKSSVGMLGQMENQTSQIDETIGLESDYFRKINRPYIYVEKIGVILVPNNNDTFVKIEYILKNVGTLPAKGVHIGTFFKRDFVTSVDSSNGFVSSSSIFPGQSIHNVFRQALMPIDEYISYPYFLIYILYSDIGGSKYSFQQTYNIIYEKVNGTISLHHPTTKWTEFE